MPTKTNLDDQYLVPEYALRQACAELRLPEDGASKEPGARAAIGQQRASDAIEFGLQLERDGYNIVVLGRHGSQRHGLAMDLAGARSHAKRAPSDWCYVNNFADPERPVVLRFPPGQGASFRDDVKSLIDELQLAIPAAFEGEDYRNQLNAIEQETQQAVEESWQKLTEKAAEEGIAVLQTPTGFVLAPVHDGQVIDEKQFSRLPKRDQKKIEAATTRLGEELRKHIEEMPNLRKALRERVRKLDQDVTAHAVTVLISELKSRHAGIGQVVDYIDQVRAHIIANAQSFRQAEEPQLPFVLHDSSRLFAQYEVNLIVSNAPTADAPVVYESNPTYPNLIGRVEHRAEMGALVTDFRLVRGGALHQANGGYLILDADRLLRLPFVWDALKQSLMSKHVRIEAPGETLGFVSTTTLKPEPIPLDLKVVLICERWLYYLLCEFDREFSSLFKVVADFDDDLERNTDTMESYAGLILHRAAHHELLEFDGTAVRKIIEQQSRHANDGERLSMHIRTLDDLLIQADYWARHRNATQVEAVDVVEAVRQRVKRLSRVQSRIVDEIVRDTLLIDTSGETVGQVNGLSVVQLGDYAFGHPVRITATTRVGTGEVLDIEREVELGGAIHSKGVLILSSALAVRYARDVPLSLHASVVFEQTYGGVEGDSASVAELCALVSSLAGIPIRQSLAVTGSVNQLGRVQVIGGVNEKVEGFYRTCKERGLDGSHGVIIPKDNVKHLMLEDEVVDAVKEGKFHVYAIESIDDALTLLTGVHAGARDDTGRYPDGTVNRRAQDQLLDYAKERKHFAEHGVGAGNNG